MLFFWPGLSVLAGEFSLIIQLQVLQFCLILRLAFIRECVWWRYPPVCRFFIRHSEEPRLNSIQSHHIYGKSLA